MSGTKTQIMISIGSGGVGKTTFSAAYGYYLAELGKKVLVLTIDPSKRLATTLGIEGTKDITRVPGQNFKGELFASVIDHQKVFDDFIIKASNHSPNIEKILHNNLYLQLSTNLSGSQEFTALEKLYSCYESNEFDWIILDTPPAKHAIDFLNAPEKLSALFNENITRWFKEDSQNGSWFQSLIAAGTKKVLKALEKLTGSEFVKELGLFFTFISDWQQKLQERTAKVHELLMSPNTQFFLVTSFDEGKLKEGLSILNQIVRQGYSLTHVVMNRVKPLWNFNEEPNWSVLEEQKEKQEIQRLYLLIKNYYLNKNIFYEKFINDLKKNVKVIGLADYNHSISDLQGLRCIADEIKKEVQ